MGRRCGRRRRNVRRRCSGRWRWRNMRWRRSRRRRRNMRWGCGRRRNMRWRSRGRRRRRSRRRCCGRWWWRGRGSRGGGRRCCLRWLLGLSIRTNLLLGLRHDQRRGLRVRWSSSHLQRGEGCRGKQQESKFCHGGLGPRKIPGKKVWQQGLSTNSGDQRTSVRPDCGILQTRTCIYFRHREFRIRLCSLRIQAIVQDRSFCIFPVRLFAAPRTGVRPGCRQVNISSQYSSRYFPCRSRGRVCSVPAVHAPAIHPVCGLAIPLAAETHLGRAWAVAPPAEGFQVGFPAVAPRAGRV